MDRYPKSTDNLTHGWRWYRVENGRLLSPLAPGRMELPRDGGLDFAYFIPAENAELLFWATFRIQGTNQYDVAATFGTVKGPFAFDRSMPEIGSMQCTRYKALCMFTESPQIAELAKNYDFPIAPSLSHTAITTFRVIPATVDA
jgi:hypothetical protein